MSSLESDDVKKLMAEVEVKKGFVDGLVESTYITEPYYLQGRTQVIVARKWNSWYPTYFDADGGCYAVLTSDQETNKAKNCGVIVIDPGFQFMGILRRMANIETEDIKKVIVTHYHPDHVAGLIEFATLKTASGSPCELYLNKTSFEAYHRIESKNLTLHEIDSHHTELLAEYTSFDGYSEQIFLTTTRAHHEELGYAHNALGVKLEIAREGKKIFRIGITGDTDGNPNYMEEYAKDFVDSDLLIMHLGTFSNAKFGLGGKHLYPRGVDLLLDRIKEICPKHQGKIPKKVVVLSEFGLELATPRQIEDTLRPSVRSLSWRLPLILSSKLMGDMTFEQRMYASMTVDYLCSLDGSCPKDLLDEAILALGLSVLSAIRNQDMKRELERFAKIVDEELVKTQEKAWALSFSFEKGNKIVSTEFSQLTSEVLKLISLISEVVLEKSRNGKCKNFIGTCELLKYHLLNMISKRHLVLIIQPLWEPIIQYANSIHLGLSEAGPLHQIPFPKDRVLSAALLGLLSLRENYGRARRDPDSLAPISIDHPLLEVARIFQRTRNDWCKILIGEIGSRFSFDCDGNALVYTRDSAWASPWEVTMKYDMDKKTIAYERAVSESMHQ